MTDLQSTEVDREELVRLYYDEGKDLAEVGEELGIGKSTVANLMERHDLPRRKGGGRTRAHSAEDVLEIAHDAAPEPVTASEVAEQLDITRRTAYSYLSDLSSVDESPLETKLTGARSRVWWYTGDNGE